MATYSVNGGSWPNVGTNIVLYLDVTTTHVVGSGTRIDVSAYATSSSTNTYNSYGTGTRSMSIPGATTSDFVTPATSASASWTYSWNSNNTSSGTALKNTTVTVYTFTRYVPYSYGTSTTVTINAAGNYPTNSLSSESVSTTIALFSAPAPAVTVNSYPSISGTGYVGSNITASSGSYNNISGSPTLKIVTVTSSSLPVTMYGTYSSMGNPYTVTSTDAISPQNRFIAVDVVTGQDGQTYYFYSSGQGGAGVTSVSTSSVITATTPPTYTVSYDANGGSGAPGAQTKTYNVNLTLSSTTPSRTGYIFNGWNTASDYSGTTYSSGGTYSTDASVTLYAIWVAASYNLYYDANGGSVSPSSKLVTYNSTYGTLATPTRSGYTFNGWFTATSGGSQITSSTTYSTASDSTIYAQWTANTYTLTYNANGGLVSPASKTVTYNSTYGTLPTPTRVGYTFNGWFTASTGGTQITSSNTYVTAGDSTIYAQWTAALPVFSDQQITTTAILNKNINTNIDYTVAASPVTGYSIVYSGTGLNPTSWLSITKDSGSNNGLLSGIPPQIGVYTFIVRATNAGGGDTDSSLITLTVLPAGKRFTGSTATQLSIAKRFDGTSWVDLKVMKRFDGTSWQDIGNI